MKGRGSGSKIKAAGHQAGSPMAGSSCVFPQFRLRVTHLRQGHWSCSLKCTFLGVSQTYWTSTLGAGSS